MKKWILGLVLLTIAMPLVFAFNPNPMAGFGGNLNTEGLECKGDMNHDLAVNAFDIEGFQKFLIKHNRENFWRADVNDDGFVDHQDIRPFIKLISTGELICR